MARTHGRIGGTAMVTAVLTSSLVVAAPSSTADAASTITCSPVTGAAVDHSPLASYTPIVPVRLIDTRDGTGGVATAVGAGCTLAVDLTSSPTPDNAQAVALSITAVAAQRGFLTVFACEEGRPSTSNLNTRAGIPTPNLVVAAVGSDRRVCIYSSGPTDVVVDLAGWWSAGPDRYQSVDPVRVYDSREVTPVARVLAGSVLSIPLVGAGAPAGATAVAVNLTVADPVADGWLVAFPCGTAPPLASNLNFVAGEARAVAALVGIGSGGGICVMSSVDTHVVVDLTGAYSPAPAFGPAAQLDTTVGHRVVDTREAGGPWTTPFAAGEVRSILPLSGTPFDGRSSSVVLNIVATNTTEPGWVAVFPCGADVPLVSTLNFVAAGETTNLVLTELSAQGSVCVKASAPTDIVIDLFGVMRPPDASLAERMSITGRVMFPDFTPHGTDYAVVCNSGASTLTLDLDLLPGVTARANGVPIGLRTEVSVPADGLTTVVLWRGAELSTYYFRCVPPDFPVLDVDARIPAAPGWYLTTLGMGSNTSGSFSVILDERGAPVWFKRTDVDVIDFKRLSTGRFAYTPLLGNAFGITPQRGYRITDLFGNLIAEHFTDDPSANPVDHHDYVELPNGGRAMLTYPLIQDYDLSSLGAGFNADDSIVDGVIQELDATGTATWTWATRQHFGLDEVTFPQRFGLYPSEPNGGEVDLFHLNSLAVLENGDYLVSARHLDAVFRVDRATGGVTWILGGSSDNPRPGRLTIVGDPLGGPLRPHDARLTGNVLTLFDNRTGTAGPARAVAYTIDAAAGTATMLWQIAEPLDRPSNGLGSVRVAPDGSVLVTWGGLQPMFEEFAADGTSLTTIAAPAGHQSYRIVKYPPATFSAAILRATAGGTAEAPT